MNHSPLMHYLWGHLPSRQYVWQPALLGWGPDRLDATIIRCSCGETWVL